MEQSLLEYTFEHGILPREWSCPDSRAYWKTVRNCEKLEMQIKEVGNEICIQLLEQILQLNEERCGKKDRKKYVYRLILQYFHL